MSKDTIRNYLALGFLLVGVLFVQGIGRFKVAVGEWVTEEHPYEYVADFDYWQRTDHERRVNTTHAFDLAHDLNEVPLTFDGWHGRDVPQDNIGVFMVLEPDQYIERLYYNEAGQHLWLTMIGGRSSRTFHPPESCYQSYGWQTQLTSQVVPLEEGGEVHGLLVEAYKKEAEQEYDQLSFYFYLFPEATRDPSDGIVIFRLTSPRYGTVEETMAVHGEFLRHFFKRAQPTSVF